MSTLSQHEDPGGEISRNRPERPMAASVCPRLAAPNANSPVTINTVMTRRRTANSNSSDPTSWQATVLDRVVPGRVRQSLLEFLLDIIGRHLVPIADVVKNPLGANPLVASLRRLRFQ